jgi:hypothetical protein
MSEQGSGKQLKTEMTRYGARLPEARAKLVTAKLEETGLSQQRAVETLLTAWARGFVDIFELMRQVHAAEAKDTPQQ